MNSKIKMAMIIGLRAMMRGMYIFPIKNNRVVINAYRGSQYSCNPKYISEYLEKNYPNTFEIMWAFNEPEKFTFLKERGIRLLKFNSFKRFYYEATCKYSINNVGSYSWFPIRKGQEHINTWHGGFGVKKCGLGEIANDELMKKTIQMSSDETTIVLSTSKEFDRDIAAKDLGFKKETMHIGYPRNDILVKQKNGKINLRNKVCNELGIMEKAFIVLYAPTWRYDVTKKLPPIEYNELVKVFEETTGKKTIIVTRMHHLMRSNMGDADATINATTYPDMQELLAVADCLITDYSSSVWDYSLMERPIFLYTPDIEQYTAERGCHVSVFDWGFPVCQNNDELLQNVRNMTEESGRIAAANFQQINGSYENGTACQQIAEYMVRHM